MCGCECVSACVRLCVFDVSLFVVVDGAVDAGCGSGEGGLIVAGGGFVGCTEGKLVSSSLELEDELNALRSAVCV